jgi:hypothetical protein
MNNCPHPNWRVISPELAVCAKCGEPFPADYRVSACPHEVYSVSRDPNNFILDHTYKGMEVFLCKNGVCCNCLMPVTLYSLRSFKGNLPFYLHHSCVPGGVRGATHAKPGERF